MKKIYTLFFILFISSLPKAQIITTIAGNGFLGFSGNGGPATDAMLHYPRGIAFDQNGTMYFCENDLVRMVDAQGTISTFAGSGNQGFNGDNILALDADLNGPTGIAFDQFGDLYFTDTWNARIRKIDMTTNIITTVAGNGSTGYSGDNGQATQAWIQTATSICFDDVNNMYIADQSNSRIRKVDYQTGIISTFAGNGNSGYSGEDGPAVSAAIGFPYSCVIHASNLYISSGASSTKIRKVDLNTGIISSVCGTENAGFYGDGGLATNAWINGSLGICLDETGNLYIADQSNYRIRKVDAYTGIITTIAGNGNTGSSGDGILATDASITATTPFVYGTDLYFSEAPYNVIRKVTNATSTVDENSLSRNSVSVAPNPMQDHFYVSHIPYKSLSRIFDVNGKQVFSAEINPDEAIDVSQFEEGIYVLSVADRQFKLVKL